MRADFYILKNQKATAIYPFVCRLLQKISSQQLRCWIQLNTEAEAKTLDQLIWTFNDTSFIPHAIVNGANAQAAPIILGWTQSESEAESEYDIYINLTTTPISETQQVKRIIEIVPDEPNWLTHSRQVYQAYQQRQLQLHVHQI